jgi:hypothetical protein
MAIAESSPAFMYPDSDYFAAAGINSPAETITWFFRLDSATSDPNDYVLFRQVNDGTPETVTRNVYRTAGVAFFRYYYKRVPLSGLLASSLDSVPTSWMPIRHSQAIHGSVADTGVAARIDSLAAVQISFTITNGLSGTAQKTRAVSYMVPMPNIGIKKATSCGDAPILGTALTANWQIDNSVSPPDTLMRLTWNQAVDEVGGERDVVRYVIWRRPAGASTWGEPIASVAAGPASPSWADESAVVGPPGYQYALAAQDCTPTLSTTAVATAPLSPP